MADHPTYDIAVSIINYRTADLTLACVQSVLDDMGDVNGHIVIVDNASGDGSAEIIQDWLAAQPKPVPVTFVQSEINGGFSSGHNQGMQACDASYYLVLNSDAVLRPGFMAAMLAAAAVHPKAGLIAPRLEGDDGVVQISHFRAHSPQSELIRAAASGPVTRLFQKYNVPLPPEDPTAAPDIAWVSFACVLLRADMVADIGFMDEDYFLYFEDAEYCLRAVRAGWTIALAPKAVAVHFRGGSGPVKALEKAKKRLPTYFYYSRTRFLYQAHGRVGLIAANLAWHVGRGLAQLRRLAGKPVPPVAASEARDIWTNVGQPLVPFDLTRQ